MDKLNTLQSDLVNIEMYEFIEFQVGNSVFGIDIKNVREIVEPLPVTILPHSHPFVEGIVQLRGEVLPVIDLKKVTGSTEVGRIGESKYIVVEFGGNAVALNVTSVSQIERINSNEIEFVTDMYEGNQVPVLGVIKRDAGMVLLVDFEKVITEKI